MTNLADLLERNSTYAQHHRAQSPFPQFNAIVVSCLDPRTDPAHFLGMEAGDALVLRTVGGRVTEEVIDEVAFVATLLETMRGAEAPPIDVVVCHHTQCGSAIFDDPTFRVNYANRIGADPDSLTDHAVTDPAATVRVDVDRLRTSSKLPSSIAVSGYVFDVESGALTELVSSAAV